MALKAASLRDDDLLPIPVVEAETGHARQTLVRWILEGKLAAIAIPAGSRRRYLVRRSTVAELVRNRAGIGRAVEQPA